MNPSRADRPLFILFTDWFCHREQKDTWDCDPRLKAAFRRRVARLARELEVSAIAEEMHWHAIAKSRWERRNREEGRVGMFADFLAFLDGSSSDGFLSEANEVAVASRLPYYPCDLGIHEQLQHEQNPIAEDREAEQAKLHRYQFDLREEAWIRNLDQIKEWPVLFICGSGHRDTLLTKARAARLQVAELTEETEPGPVDLVD